MPSSNVIREWIGKQSDEVIVSIIRGHEKWEREGSIVGDDPLRTYANSLMNAHATGITNIIFWMEDLVFEAYRLFAHRYIKSKKPSVAQPG